MVYMSEMSGFPGLTIEEKIRIGAQFLRSTEARRRAKALAANPKLLVMDEPALRSQEAIP